MYYGPAIFRAPRTVAAGGGGSFAISGVTGTKSHGSSITIAGAQFGTKSSPGPVVYDDASGTDPLTTGWNEASPNAISATYDMAYRTLPVTNGSVATLPHSHVTKAICGCHNGSGAFAGQSVHLEQYRVVSSRPQYTFFSCWMRMDPGFDFLNDIFENFKFYDIGTGNGGYNLPNNYYWEGGTGGNTWGTTTKNDTMWWHVNSDTQNPAPPDPIDNPDNNGHGLDWDDFPSPFAGWRKHEYLVKWATDTTGYVKIWDGGVLVVNYSGPTDMTNGGWAADGTDRYDMLGGYSGGRGVHSWRYFCDVYYDQTPSRVILGNASTIGACTIKEPQVCTAWSATSITATMKHGAIPTGSAWLYVFDSTNTATAGFPVTLV